LITIRGMPSCGELDPPSCTSPFILTLGYLNLLDNEDPKILPHESLALQGREDGSSISFFLLSNSMKTAFEYFVTNNRTEISINTARARAIT